MTARDSRRQKLRDGEPFHNSSKSLVGETRSARGWIGDGWLYSHAPRWAAELTERREHIDYVIYSYATPIAWHDLELGWVIPDVKYSVTTSHHQYEVRSALAVGWRWNAQTRELERDGETIPFRTVPLGVLRDTYATFDGDVAPEVREYLTLAGSLG